jgi:hypothetical protein
VTLLAKLAGAAMIVKVSGIIMVQRIKLGVWDVAFPRDAMKPPQGSAAS